MSTLALTSNTLAVTAGAGQIEYNGQFFATDSNASRGQVERITQGTAISATGTSIDFTGIPAWVKRITLMYSGLSTNGTSTVQFQFGTSGGIDATNYFNANVNSSAGGIATSTSATATGVITDNAGAATYVRNGMLTIVNLTGNTWSYSGGHSETATGRANTQYGTKTLSAILDRVRVTTVNGTDTFDAGSINIMYEG